MIPFVVLTAGSGPAAQPQYDAAYFASRGYIRQTFHVFFIILALKWVIIFLRAQQWQIGVSKKHDPFIT
jgi:hypothetical protein